MGLSKSALSAAISLLTLISGGAALAQVSISPEWMEVYKGDNGTVVYIQARGVGSARLGKDVWFKGVHADGSWLIVRDTIDCTQHVTDNREGITFDQAGNLTGSYFNPENQHNWTASAPNSSGEAMEMFACFVPPEKP